MQHVLVIHGGTAFDSYEDYLAELKAKEFDIARMKLTDWKAHLPETLGEGYDVWAPRMPNPNNAHFEEWRIWFEKAVARIPADPIFIGHSLGGIFVAKYLAEYTPVKQPRATFLVAAPHSAASQHSLGDFVLPDNLTQLETNAGALHFYHSTDDPVVPYASFEHYTSALPKASAHAFTDRQHFNREEFPEIVEHIKALG